MNIKNILERVWCAKGRRERSLYFRPIIETLESRLCPASTMWAPAANTANLNWSNAANWTNGVPAADIDVIFDGSNSQNCLGDIGMDVQVASMTFQNGYDGRFYLDNHLLTVVNDFGGSNTDAMNANRTVDVFFTGSNSRIIVNGITTLYEFRFGSEGAGRYVSNGVAQLFGEGLSSVDIDFASTTLLTGNVRMSSGADIVLMTDSQLIISNIDAEVLSSSSSSSLINYGAISISSSDPEAVTEINMSIVNYGSIEIETSIVKVDGNELITIGAEEDIPVSFQMFAGVLNLKYGAVLRCGGTINNAEIGYYQSGGLVSALDGDDDGIPLSCSLNSSQATRGTVIDGGQVRVGDDSTYSMLNVFGNMTIDKGEYLAKANYVNGHHDVLRIINGDLTIHGGSITVTRMSDRGSDNCEIILAPILMNRFTVENLQGATSTIGFSQFTLEFAYIVEYPLIIVNNPPAGTDQTVTLTHDTPYTFTESDFGFSDPSDSPGDNFLAVKISSLPSAGTLFHNGSPVDVNDLISLGDIIWGGLVYMPGLHGVGTGYADFDFQVQDDGGDADGGIDLDPTPNTITFDVTNTAPGVNDPTYYTPHDQTLTDTGWGLLGYAWDYESDALSVSAIDGNSAAIGQAVTTTLGGTLTVQADGTFVYLPPTATVGVDSFTFTVTDGVASTTATVTIEVTNNAPGVNDPTYYTPHDQTLTDTGWGLLGYAWDYENDALSVSAIDGNSAAIGQAVTTTLGGTLTVQTDGTFVYLPPTATIGVDSFTFTVTDGVASTTATVTIEVTNNAPGVNDPTYYTPHDQTLTDTGWGLLGYAWDYENDALSVSAIDGNSAAIGQAVTTPLGGTLTVQADGTFVYLPPAATVGVDSFTFIVTDGVASTTATVTIHVTNNAPGVYDVQQDTPVNTTITGGASLLNWAWDYENDALRVSRINGQLLVNGSITLTTANGATLTVHEDGALEYVPAANSAYDDVLTFTVTDGIEEASANLCFHVYAI